jgi:toxin-antitoxin system PIN domain toxin
MKVVDANVLLYAINSDAVQHEDARRWMEGALNGEEAIGFSWTVLLAFLRLSTRRGLFARPLEVAEAIDMTDEWLAQPPAVIVQPTTRHGAILRGLLGSTGSGGNLVNDAHLAALAVEHGAEIVSYDTDFERFNGVRCRTPAEA